MGTEFVRVSKDFKPHVIGKGGHVIQDMRQRSGAEISSASREEEGFTVSGDTGQIACAKRLILEKVEEIRSWELVEIPNEYKGMIIGKGGSILREISKRTGAELSRSGGDVFIINGTEHERKQAKVNIGIRVAGARFRGVENKFNNLYCFIDGWNLPKNCKLKLEQVEQEDRIVLPGIHQQYRLKPTKEFETQEPFISDDTPSYMEELDRAASKSLNLLKSEKEANQYLEADMWCHFGTAIVRRPVEEEAEKQEEWSIEEAIANFQKTATGGSFWRVAFKEGVDLVEDIFKGNYCEESPDEYSEYATRYDLTYLTPCGFELRCKVWVAKDDIEGKLADLPVPFSDVKNILEEIHFEDELTRSRCHGWLVVPSRRYLQADILFPGCEFDCRLTIRERTESAIANDYVPKVDVRRVLAQYLTGLTLVKDDSFGLRLPETEIPEGFHLIHKRSSQRTVYSTRPGFSIILSKESAWRSYIAEERSRESTDLHLHCKEWDKLLSTGRWEPELILRKLPEFLHFVKEVQGLVINELKRIESTRKIPPEILARGPLALEAYNSALVEGETCVKRVPFMMIGQARSGKTSLTKSLRGIRFNPEEDSTVGIDVDQYDFKVTSEIWETGKKDEEENSVTEAISFEHNTARFVVERLRGKEGFTESRTGSVDSGGSFDSEDTALRMETQLSESSGDLQPIETSRNGTPGEISHESKIPAEDVSDPAGMNAEDDKLIMTQISEFDEIAVITEKLLQDNWVEDKTHVYTSSLSNSKSYLLFGL